MPLNCHLVHEEEFALRVGAEVHPGAAAEALVIEELPVESGLVVQAVLVEGPML